MRRVTRSVRSTDLQVSTALVVLRCCHVPPPRRPPPGFEPSTADPNVATGSAATTSGDTSGSGSSSSGSGHGQKGQTVSEHLLSRGREGVQKARGTYTLRTSKAAYYGAKGYDFVERMARIAHGGTGENAPDATELRNHMIIVGCVITVIVVLVVNFVVYKTVVITTDPHRRNFTRGALIASDMVYLQRRWPFTVNIFQLKPHSSLLAVERRQEDTATRSDLCRDGDLAGLQVGVAKSLSASGLYRHPRDRLIVVERDPATGRNVEKRIRYNRFLYKALLFMPETEVPVVVDLKAFADPYVFQKYLAQFRPHYHPTQTSSQQQQQPQASSTDKGKATSTAGGKQPNATTPAAVAPVINGLLHMKIRVRVLNSSITDVGSKPFVQEAVRDAARSVFLRYYQHAILHRFYKQDRDRHHASLSATASPVPTHQSSSNPPSSDARLAVNMKLCAMMLENGQLNGTGITMDDVFLSNSGAAGLVAAPATDVSSLSTAEPVNATTTSTASSAAALDADQLNRLERIVSGKRPRKSANDNSGNSSKSVPVPPALPLCELFGEDVIKELMRVAGQHAIIASTSVALL